MNSRNFVNLNINPCKMCMPMGAVLAFKGIEGNMVIIHGSQGCSTYIRRHMATHYNEPIDIASSSLTENGTIYGGTKNLKAGLKNLVKLYNPTTIGVVTTCLAETIGEDISRIVREFYEEEKDNEDIKDLKIITVPTPGYGGTQAEGYYRALRKTVEQLAVKTEATGKINIIAANLNPGDIRNIKNILQQFGVGYTILPDVSDTLDAPHDKEYGRLPKGGTKIEDIAKMSGAVATIEMGMTAAEEDSPGVYLQQEFGVPFYKCGSPIGLRNTDEFIALISKVTGKPIPESLAAERGRYLDAMIDSHKYNGEARAIIYGEPELVLSVTKTCVENGVFPKIIALGAKNDILKQAVKEELKDQVEESIILDDTDFETIEHYAKDADINVIIGNSDGRRMAERLNLKIVRIGFPVHDRVGAQRQVFTGYNGSANLIDNIANTILEDKENNFREYAYDKYFAPSEEGKDNMVTNNEPKVINLNIAKNSEVKTIEDKTCTHPCYGENAHQFARMHVPVAPKCNISCNYCSRKYDCANESRPGVTSEVLTPEEALYKFKEVKSRMPNLTVLGIAGPGDALANFEQTKKTIELIKAEDPNVTFCLSTNGLMLPFYANELVELGISHVTVTLNCVDPKIGAKIYREVNYLGTKLTGEEGAQVLLNNQLSGLRYLASKGLVCKVNIVMIKGINDDHIVEVVKKAKECGAFMTNIMQLIPVKESAFADMPLVSNQELNDKRKECEQYMKQMYHCKQCRADAIGTLAEDRSIDFRDFKCGSGCNSGGCGDKSEEKAASIKNYKFAVSTKSGINIDQHFGHAEEFHIYSYTDGDIRFLEKREVNKYCTGADECDDHQDKIEKTINTIKDCDAVLTLRAGMEPTKKLEAKGIKLIQMYDVINDGINRAVKEFLA
ncbi:nitrogenase cofactor biosynthesis protein NifB [Clostridium sp. DJ247]|uniref:nitrogenase cofactor biosynthesis protein NifB n=1 Tax=Clostridium sp. DJ247 TaxID=2726188 RepID=UPI001625C896|nr:nitrogenase cofactor biosynthesis protein NifB [Clostridium sp. DJ247]MBC2582418.1 nitrogenase cofactor biosynthesis protein NifB [Clostridium sp. DJ247]